MNSAEYSSINGHNNSIQIQNTEQISDSIDRDDLSKRLQELEMEREKDIKIKRI